MEHALCMILDYLVLIKANDVPCMVMSSKMLLRILFDIT